MKSNVAEGARIWWCAAAASLSSLNVKQMPGQLPISLNTVTLIHIHFIVSEVFPS